MTDPVSFASVAVRDRLAQLLDEKPCLVADGAMGTNLFALGLQTGDAPELWNVDEPERVIDLHRRMVEAGADIILTNTFGGTRHRMKLHQAQDRVRELNGAAARLARQVADQADRPVLVAGSMGPTGEILEPIGALAFDDAVAAFREQAEALAEGGVDLLWIETMSSREEAQAAIDGGRDCGLPIVCTMTFDTNGRTMMGLTPEAAIDFYCHRDPALAACGANCGNGFGELIAAVAGMSRAGAGSGAILVAKGNCGIPEFVDGEIRYTGTPELMKIYARMARDAGARIIGGCCGSTPEHIRAIAEALDGYQPGVLPDLAGIDERLGLNRAAAVDPGDRPERHRRRARRS
jgi:5-methyltetrahydrofolate--homocysteine methyltransferase